MFKFNCKQCGLSFVREHRDYMFCSKKCYDVWQMGKHNSPNTEFKKGCQVNLGKKRSVEICNKFSIVQKKRWENSSPWNKGKNLSQEIKEKIRKTLLGRNLSEKHKINIKNSMKGKNRGPNNPMWKGGERVFGKYVYITTEDGKFITEHRYIMEKYLKRPLGNSEVVHHKNRLRHDNRIENLEIMDKKEHSRYHILEYHRSRR